MSIVQYDKYNWITAKSVLTRNSLKYFVYHFQIYSNKYCEGHEKKLKKMETRTYSLIRKLRVIKFQVIVTSVIYLSSFFPNVQVEMNGKLGDNSILQTVKYDEITEELLIVTGIAMYQQQQNILYHIGGRFGKNNILKRLIMAHSLK